MKIAVSGKGGVGKTTVAALLAGALAVRGRAVVALDADPDANLASALGLPDDQTITPLAEMHELIQERTGAGKDQFGGYFKLNPRVDDIPEKYARRIGNIRLLVLGGVSKGGAGCICPATAVLKALLIHLVLGREDAIVMDMEAGIEHLGRATAESMDAMILVVDEAPWSIQTAHRAARLAADIGLRKLFAVANRVTSDTDLKGIVGGLKDIPLIGQLPYDKWLTTGVFQVLDGKVEPGRPLRRHLPTAEAILRQLESRL
jgi:CO dehydrogenase maturation factor